MAWKKSVSQPRHEVPTISEGGGIRYLHFGTEWVQGAMWVSKPAELVLEYTAQMMAWLLFLAPGRQQTIGMLGLGAGSLARFCLKQTPCKLRVIEWNPLVTSACEMYFKLPRPERMLIEHLDAGVWVADPSQHDQCAVLLVDVYDGEAAGPVRDSLAFYQNCRDVLGEIGVMTVNLFGAHASFEKNIRRLSEAFEGRLLSLPQIDAGNQIVLAFKGPLIAIDIEQLLARAEVVESQYGLPAKKWVRSMIGRSNDGILTV
ncbi:MAG: spermidine synthase [Burkholderiaceae bacterium]|jgi:spermidine synthase|nr:spermidine synthase [Burkholderiaceae bacterium]MDP4968746.1 spermidine synthase [Burkholderiaceae bacterium]MDP5112010.1 spermidine synthase [Burkholderiaceae bacterium]